MKTALLLFAAVCIAGWYSSFALHADETPAANPFQPGTQHELLKRHVGTFDAVVIWAGPDGKEQRSSGKQTTKSSVTFNTIDDFQGECFGTNFVGHGINGFCGARQKYFTLWTDSMTSSPMVLFGDYDARSKELRLAGECLGMSGRIEPCRTVTQFQDDDHYSFEFYGPGPDGKEVRHLRIEYTRAK